MDLRIPTHPVRVELRLQGRDTRIVELYLAEQARSFRPLEVLDLLQEQRFLPARDPTEHAWVLFNRDAVLWVSLPLRPPGPGRGTDAGSPAPLVAEREEELFEHRAQVRVELLGGLSLDGKLLYTSAPERARVSDYLNGPECFFPLFTDDTLFLVNKAFLVRVIEAQPRSPQET
jgi:hypothetical protein